MADNNQLLEQLNKRFDTIEKNMATKTDIQRVEQNQTQTTNSLAHITTAVESVKAGQDDLREKVANLPTRPEFQDFRASVGRKLQDHESRIEDLEKDAGIPHPHKH